MTPPLPIFLGQSALLSVSTGRGGFAVLRCAARRLVVASEYGIDKLRQPGKMLGVVNITSPDIATGGEFSGAFRL